MGTRARLGTVHRIDRPALLPVHESRVRSHRPPYDRRSSCRSRKIEAAKPGGICSLQRALETAQALPLLKHLLCITKEHHLCSLPLIFPTLVLLAILTWSPNWRMKPRRQVGMGSFCGIISTTTRLDYRNPWRSPTPGYCWLRLHCAPNTSSSAP